MNRISTAAYRDLARRLGNGQPFESAAKAATGIVIPKPNYTIRTSDGNYEYMADEHEVREWQRQEDAMALEKRVVDRDRANKGVGR